ncbi:DEAD/DEAH box helicase [Pseudoalteromonas xiamenensis]
MPLPIDPLKAPFLNALEQGNVVVSAATGSGKSTRLPIWAAASGSVLVVQPRRIACTALAEYLAEQSGAPLGHHIGYAIRFEQAIEENCNVVFATPGVALRWYFENRLEKYTTVILDEFHERRWDMDLLLAILQKRAQHRLVLTSATLQGELFAKKLNATLLNSDGSLFPVEEHFIASDMRAMPTKEHLAERVKQACEIALEDTTGDILVFLPGKGEIQFIKTALSSLNIEVIPLFSGCDKRFQENALKVQTHRRIILATNVAETSLTIPNVTCVVDSGLERRTHLRQGRTVLGLESIARDSAKQRKGRAGRTQSGLCIRLYGQHAPLIEKTPPEIHRESLTELVLAAACLDDGVDGLPFFEPLPESAKQLAVNTLQNLGAIDSSSGQATELGKSLYPLPLDVELGQLIISMPSSTLRQAVIDLVSVIAVPATVYSLPTSVDALDALNKQFPDACDITISIAVLRGLIPDMAVDAEALKEARQYSEMLRAHFLLPELAKASSYDKSALLHAIIQAQPERLFIKRNNRRDTFANGKIEISLAKQSYAQSTAQSLLVMSTFTLAGRGTKNAVTLATIASPIVLNRVSELIPTQESIVSVQFIDSQLSVTIEKRYADVVLTQYQRSPSTEELPSVLAKAIEQQMLMPSLFEQVKMAIRYHQISNQLKKDLSQVPEPIDYLTQQVIKLGIESFDDLELVTEADFQYDGIEAWEIESLKDKFPLKLVLANQNLNVRYALQGKKVTIEYESGSRKEAPKRWELPAWSGLAITYQRASKVVPIK